jgi:hypothetical protein
MRKKKKKKKKKRKKWRTKEINRERWWTIKEQKDKHTLKEKKKNKINKNRKKNPWFVNSSISVLVVLVLPL